MIHLTYSNHSERLLDALLEHLDGSGPFEPAHLVVPNHNVEAFVTFGLARARGIAANLSVRFLRRFVTEIVEASRPGLTVVDAPLTHGLLIALLGDDKLLGDPDLDRVRAYLYAEGRVPDVVERRRYQLSAQLANLFDEYGLSRPELLEAWRKNRPSELAGMPEWQGTERWQRRLWRALHAKGGLLERRGAAFVTLDDFFRAPPPLVLPPKLHVFGISYVARLFHRVLEVMAASTELHVYTLNPCEEYWEDIRPIDLSSDDPFGLETADTPALRLWGRPGRENIRLLNELTECDFASRFEDPTAQRDTLLARLQRDVLRRAPERRGPETPESEPPDDGSVRVLACPGVRRELEIIAGEIWRLLPGSNLKLNDIAVIVPAAQKDLYHAHLQAVFREMHELPHTIVDLPLASESRIVEAVELLLALPLSGFQRQDLLRLLAHPAVMRRFPDATPDEWLGWCDALGIVHGADKADHQGTYIAGDLYNWDQGLKRLALGAFMTGRRSGDERSVTLAGEAYLPEEHPQSSVSSAAAFGLTARSLIEDARFARSARLGLPEWLRFLRGMLSSYLIPEGDADERVLLRCLAELQALETVDLDGGEVAYRIPYELATAGLGRLQGSRGQYLAEGVVVSSFLPMRAIPFRAVFVAGLGEGLFPAVDRPDNLDLRRAKRRPGDVTAREQDRYLFLETLLCARERLTLSYVARDPLTGDARQPSPVIAELAEILSGHLSAKTVESRIFQKRPLHRHEDPPTRAASPPAAREAQAHALGAHLRETAPGTTADLTALRTQLPARSYAALAATLGAPPPPPPSTADAAHPDTMRISITALRRFLECPLQGSAQFFLGMREETDEDVTTRADEPFETPRLETVSLLRDVFVRAVAEPDVNPARLAAAYDARAHAARLRGEMPSGPFAAAERAEHLEVLSVWLEALRGIAGDGPLPAVKAFRFGRAEEHAAVDELHDPVVLALPDGGHDGRPLRVELHGKTEAVLASPAGSLVLAQRSENDLKAQKDTLRGFLDHALLAASGLLPPGDFTSWVAQSEPEPYAARFAPFQPEEARAWLGTLVSELLSGVHPYLLPCEAVFKNRKPKPKPVVDLVEEMRDDGWAKVSSHYGPIKDAMERYESPTEDEAQVMIDRRFGPYFRRLVT